MKGPLHHINNPHLIFDHFHKNLHHAFFVFALAIIGMLWGAMNILNPIASWQWGTFLNQDFWSQNPSNANIMYALFGDGTTGSTAYTRPWQSSCIPTNVVKLSTGFNGGLLDGNTIYILNAGTYIITNTIDMENCSALIGNGNVYLKKTTTGNVIDLSFANNVIIDNLKISKTNISNIGIYGYPISNITINNIDLYNLYAGIEVQEGTNMYLNNSRIYNTTQGTYISEVAHVIFNNIQLYNNTYGTTLSSNNKSTINNSQFYNNTYGIRLLNQDIDPFLLHNSMIYNNQQGIISSDASLFLNQIYLYNNTTGLTIEGTHTGTIYGTLKIFGNTHNIALIGSASIITGTIPPLSSWVPGTIDTTDTSIHYDRFTNPQNNDKESLLEGLNPAILIGPQLGFNINKTPLRYIFGYNIIKQQPPVLYTQDIIKEFGINKEDYDTSKYITEPESSLYRTEQNIINQYYGSGSLYTRNRNMKGCSLGAFQIVTLTGGYFSTPIILQDHTIYLLTGGEYRANFSMANFIIFNGNCIALVGTPTTRITKSSPVTNLLYANNKRNIIIDTLKIDGKYYNIDSFSSPSNVGIKFDGNSNNNTLNNIQSYNHNQYGIYLGIGSHHNTLFNSQFYNNGDAGIHLYYSSNYNIINNTQSYNNTNYGIRFANGSQRNTMNNIQSYNNTIGIFGDLTTKENIFNRAAIYNNSDAGILLKNSSSNIFNDVRIYNNTYGIKFLYNSINNTYFGEFYLFDNALKHLDGTNGNDIYLSPGPTGSGLTPSVIKTGINIMSCTYATNPIVSGTSLYLLTTGCTTTGPNNLFYHPNNAYINYLFGVDIYKQSQPFSYDENNDIIELDDQYDANKYIAEVFPLFDNTPENVFFTSTGMIELGTSYTTNTYTVATINVPTNVFLQFTPSTASGYLLISGINMGLTGQVINGDTLQIVVTSATGYFETITGTITIGSVSTSFFVTTKGYWQIPSTGSLAFGAITGVDFSVFTGKTTTITGLQTGVFASLTLDPITTLGRLEIYSGTTFIYSGTSGLVVYNGNQVKFLAQSRSGYLETVTGTIMIGSGIGICTITTKSMDTTPPTTPSIIAPLSGEKMFFIIFEWTASVDSGSGIWGYEYQIAEDSNFSGIIDTGFIVTTDTLGYPNTTFTRTKGTYYFRLRARDYNNNVSNRSNHGIFSTFKYNDRKFEEKTGANLNTFYESNKILIQNMTGFSLLAEVSGGTLYINDQKKGTGDMVKNDDIIYIVVKSSKDFNSSTSGTLTIANRALQFSITTKKNTTTTCSLTQNQKDTIQTIFSGLMSKYSGDKNKYNNFLSTIINILQDEIDLTNDCNLKYLSDLFYGKINQGGINTEDHIAPNCKKYPISFDSKLSGYTSPVMIRPLFFASRDALTRYIDSKNPGDCHINTYSSTSRIFTNTGTEKYIAPNGKIYTIQSTTDGYTSVEFIVKKYFSTFDLLCKYIDQQNILPDIRNHNIDTSFTPQIYTAPNGKEYKIYKTDKGYMSYKLLKVRYFAILEDLINFIDINNPY